MTHHYGPFYATPWLDLLLLGGLAILVIVLIVAIVRRSDGRSFGPPPQWPAPPPQWPAPGPTAPPMDPAMQILRERFARGEISEADFLSARSTLTGPPQ